VEGATSERLKTLFAAACVLDDLPLAQITASRLPGVSPKNIKDQYFMEIIRASHKRRFLPDFFRAFVPDTCHVFKWTVGEQAGACDEFNSAAVQIASEFFGVSSRLEIVKFMISHKMSIFPNGQAAYAAVKSAFTAAVNSADLRLLEYLQSFQEYELLFATIPLPIRSYRRYANLGVEEGRLLFEALYLQLRDDTLLKRVASAANPVNLGVYLQNVVDESNNPEILKFILKRESLAKKTYPEIFANIQFPKFGRTVKSASSGLLLRRTDMFHCIIDLLFPRNGNNDLQEESELAELRAKLLPMETMWSYFLCQDWEVCELFLDRFKGFQYSLFSLLNSSSSTSSTFPPSPHFSHFALFLLLFRLILPPLFPCTCAGFPSSPINKPCGSLAPSD